MAADIAAGRRKPHEVFLPSLVITTGFASIFAVIVVTIAPMLMRNFPHGVVLLRWATLWLSFVALESTVNALRQGERRYTRVTAES
jgi:O-antigen/teichoic acid export membrane protein